MPFVGFVLFYCEITSQLTKASLYEENFTIVPDSFCVRYTRV